MVKNIFRRFKRAHKSFKEHFQESREKETMGVLPRVPANK